jgi:diketogulonate reductase-like aldo/keto reductase
MLSKIAIGTANFTQSYGILSKGQLLESETVAAILQKALSVDIHTFDTAFDYGDLFQYFNQLRYQKDLEIITKFSVLDNYNELYDKLLTIRNTYGLKRFYSLLVHDPSNLEKANKKQLRQFFDKLKKESIIEKIGVSVYGFEDIKNFESAESSLFKPFISSIFTGTSY